MRARLSILMKYPLGSAAVLAFLVVLLMMGWRRVTEPRVMGQGVREWVRDLPYDSREDSDAKVAIDRLGMEATPYLLEVLDGPSDVELWMVRKAAWLYKVGVIDPEEAYRVRSGAIWELAQMAAEERLANETQGLNEYPVREAIWPEFIKVLRANLESERFSSFLNLLKELGPLKPEALALVQKWWRAEARKISPWGPRGLQEGALLLAAQGDPEVLPVFLEAANATNSAAARVAALEGIGDLGIQNAEVREILSAAVKDSDGTIRTAGLQACAMLVFVPPELELSEERFQELQRAPWERFSGSGAAEGVLYWLREPENLKRIEFVTTDFGPVAPIRHRISTLKLLGRAGPRAKCFVPALVELLDHSPRMHLQGAVIKALQQIDPERAEQERERRMVAADDAKRPAVD